MRPSQISLLAAIGLAAAVLVGLAAWIAFSATYAGGIPEAAWKEQRTRSVALEGFTGVEVRGQWAVTIERGDAWTVELSYPAAVEDRASAELEGRMLVIGSRLNGFRTGFGRGPRMSARITMPSLETLEISGAAHLEFSGFEGTELNVRASGATDLTGRSSRYRDVQLTLSGAGKLDLRDVIATNANVNLSGVGSIQLQLDGGVLSGNASGAGSIDYSGTVSEERIVKSGAVTVKRR
jgi:hypothetical protein